jgi:hypothetical protein
MNQLLATQMTTIHDDKVWISLDELKTAYQRCFGPTYVQSPLGPLPVVPFYQKPPFEVTCSTAPTKHIPRIEFTSEDIGNAIAGC